MAKIRHAALALALLAAPAAAQQSRQDVDASSGSVANAVATATLPADPRQLWVTGFEVDGNSATAASCVTLTLTGLASVTGSGVLSYAVCSSQGTSEISPSYVLFVPPRPAKSNTAVVLSLPALGTGSTSATVNLHGYYQNQ